MTSRLTVDLEALAHNYLVCHTALQGLPVSVVTGAVVKADAYGLGAAAVAGTLQAQGCTNFFVANAEEGQALRSQLAAQPVPQPISQSASAAQKATSARIFVFEGALAATIPTLLAAQLTPVLNSHSQWQLWSDVCEQTPSARQLGLVLHVDTGMQRLGFAPAELLDAPLVGVLPDMLMTHLACADEPDHPSNAEQLRSMASLVSRYPDCAISLANSAATLDPGNLAEMLQHLLAGADEEVAQHARQLLARPGIALYGGEVFAATAQPSAAHEQIWPVACLEGQVLQLREVAAGTPIGYGASFVAPRAMRIATIGLGYADGLPRLLSNNGFGFVTGHQVPIVGRVSMDLTCVDVSEATVAEGDWVEFFGANVALGDVARQAQTIDYEILCGVGARVPRRYQAL